MRLFETFTAFARRHCCLLKSDWIAISFPTVASIFAFYLSMLALTGKQRRVGVAFAVFDLKNRLDPHPLKCVDGAWPANYIDRSEFTSAVEIVSMCGCQLMSQYGPQPNWKLISRQKTVKRVMIAPSIEQWHPINLDIHCQ